MDLAKIIRNVPDFPKPGIMFRDITTLLQDPEALKYTIEHLAMPYKDQKIDMVVGIEARGFIFGPAVATILGCGFVPIRKPGKLPYKTKSVSYALEYGEDTVCIHEDALKPGDNVLVIDDLLATGGTAGAAVQLIEELGAHVVSCAFIVELTFLNGREKLGDRDIKALVKYDSE